MCIVELQLQYENVPVEHGPLTVTASLSQKLCREIMIKLKAMLKDAALKEVFTEVAHKPLRSNFEYSHIHRTACPWDRSMIFSLFSYHHAPIRVPRFNLAGPGTFALHLLHKRWHGNYGDETELFC